MRKLLVLETKSQFDVDSDQHILEFINLYSEKSVSVLYNIENYSALTIQKKLSNINDIAFQTNFEDVQQIRLFLKIFSSINKEFNVYISYYGLKEKLLKILSKEDIYLIRKLNIFEIRIYEKSNLKVNFDNEVKKYKNDILEENKYNGKYEQDLTGRLIKIISITTFGPEWAKLKSGMIVNEINCSIVDNNLRTGVWIWGVNSPLKLINSEFITEYKILEKSSIKNILSQLILTFSYNIKEEYIEQEINNILELNLEFNLKLNLLFEYFNIFDDDIRRNIKSVINSLQ